MTRRRVVTERDVRQAWAAHSGTLDVRGAAVTPAAIDLAHQLGLSLGGLTGEDRRLRRSGKPNAAGPAPAAQDSAAATPVQAPVGEPAPTGGRAAVRVALGADHGGVALKDAIAADLTTRGVQVIDQGTTGSEPVDYPDFALAVARAVATGSADFGIMVDGAGIGSCMVANKVRGIRAAMCYDVTTAANAREHNNANVLTLGGGLIGTRLGLAIVATFLDTPFAGGRHQRRVEKIDALDANRPASR